MGLGVEIRHCPSAATRQKQRQLAYLSHLVFTYYSSLQEKILIDFKLESKYPGLYLETRK